MNGGVLGNSSSCGSDACPDAYRTTAVTCETCCCRDSGRGRVRFRRLVVAKVCFEPSPRPSTGVDFNVEREAHGFKVASKLPRCGRRASALRPARQFREGLMLSRMKTSKGRSWEPASAGDFQESSKRRHGYQLEEGQNAV